MKVQDLLSIFINKRFKYRKVLVFFWDHLKQPPSSDEIQHHLKRGSAALTVSHNAILLASLVCKQKSTIYKYDAGIDSCIQLVI